MTDESYFAATRSVLDGSGWATKTPVAAVVASRAAVQPRRKLTMVDPADVEVRDIDWIEHGFLPKGELSILQGHGGTNKGSHTCYWASLVTNGYGETPPAFVLFVTAEDSLATTLKPRLIAADADMTRVRFIALSDGTYIDALRIPDDVADLHGAVVQTAAALVVIDPILTHLSSGVDSYRDHDVKRALQPLKAMAEATGCAVLAVHHFNKDTTRGALRSGQASGAFINTARVVLAMAQDDEDEDVRVLEVVKANGSRVGLRQSLRVETVAVAGVTDPVVRTVPAGAALKSVDQLLKAGTVERGTKRAGAKDAILAELANGRQTLDALKARVLTEVGASGETTYRALTELKAASKVKSRPEQPGVKGTKWFWELLSTSSPVPANPHEQTTSSHTTNDYLGRVRNEDADRSDDLVISGFATKSLPNTEVQRLIRTHRPEIEGRNDITTRAERITVAHLLKLDERVTHLKAAA